VRACFALACCMVNENAQRFSLPKCASHLRSLGACAPVYLYERLECLRICGYLQLTDAAHDVTRVAGMPTGYRMHEGAQSSHGEQGISAGGGHTTLRQNLSHVSPQSQYLKIFWGEWCLVCRDRLAYTRRNDTLVVSADKARAFGHSAHLLDELNLVISSMLESLPNAIDNHGVSGHVRRWFDCFESAHDDGAIVRLALNLEEETWTPVQKLRRQIDDQACRLIEGRRGLSFNLPHDSMCAMERYQHLSSHLLYICIYMYIYDICVYMYISSNLHALSIAVSISDFCPLASLCSPLLQRMRARAKMMRMLLRGMQSNDVCSTQTSAAHCCTE